MSTCANIQRADNGYVVILNHDSLHSTTKVFTNLDDVLANLLQHFEDRSPTFTGERYGSVKIYRDAATRP